LKIYYTEYQKPASEKKKLKKTLNSNYFNFSITNKRKKA